MNANIINSVNKAVTIKEPYDHFYIKDVFSRKEYSDILKYLPEERYYESFNHPDAVTEYGSTRLRFPLNNENLGLLDLDRQLFWTNLLVTLNSHELKMAIFNKVSDDLTTRFKMPLEEIPASPSPFLFKDISGYSISVHPDSPKKSVTFQIYLPPDDSTEDIGTCVYKQIPKVKGEKKEFVKVKRFPFLPNSAYGFAVSNHSWHGVDKLGQAGIERNSLMIIYYLDVPHHQFKY